MKFDSNCWPKHVSTVCWYIESINAHKVCYTHPLKSFSTLPQSSNAPCSANCFSSVPSITPCAYWCAMHPYILCLYPLLNICAHHFPKGLRSECVRAVTGTRCPHSAHCVLCAVYFSVQPNKLRPILKFKEYYPYIYHFQSMTIFFVIDHGQWQFFCHGPR